MRWKCYTCYPAAQTQLSKGTGFCIKIIFLLKILLYHLIFERITLEGVNNTLICCTCSILFDYVFLSCSFDSPLSESSSHSSTNSAMSQLSDPKNTGILQGKGGSIPANFLSECYEDASFPSYFRIENERSYRAEQSQNWSYTSKIHRTIRCASEMACKDRL